MSFNPMKSCFYYFRQCIVDANAISRNPVPGSKRYWISAFCGLKDPQCGNAKGGVETHQKILTSCALAHQSVISNLCQMLIHDFQPKGIRRAVASPHQYSNEVLPYKQVHLQEEERRSQHCSYDSVDMLVQVQAKQAFFHMGRYLSPLAPSLHQDVVLELHYLR